MNKTVFSGFLVNDEVTKITARVSFTLNDSFCWLMFHCLVILESKEAEDVEMEEEEEEEAKPAKKNNSKKKVEEEAEDKREHVNIIFIGHVGKGSFQPYLFVWSTFTYIL